MTAGGARVAVVVGILRQADGAVLLTSRPDAKPYAGFWEFPGGKVEPQEQPERALQRELLEEIGVRVMRCCFAWTVSHDYPHAHVNLHFYWVDAWQGDPRPLESQQLLWVRASEAWPYPVLPATVPLLPQIREGARRPTAGDPSLEVAEGQLKRDVLLDGL